MSSEAPTLTHRAVAHRSPTYWLQCAVTALLCIFLILPVLLSILAGLTVNYFEGWSSGFTTAWLVKVLTAYRESILLSVQLAIACLACNLLLGVPAAYALFRMRSRASRVIEELLVMPIAVPGLATALALIVTFGSWGELRQSWGFILVGHVLFTLPFMVRSIVAVMSSIDLDAYEEAARSLGATFWQRMLHVVIPNCMTGITAGSLMVVTLSLGEFNMTLLLHTPLTKTLPVGLADAYASLRIEIGSAYTVIFFIIIVPLLVALQRVTSTQSSRAAGGSR